MSMSTVNNSVNIIIVIFIDGNGKQIDAGVHGVWDEYVNMLRVKVQGE
jgi:hypothetical protein